jgi:hypothetical protein
MNFRIEVTETQIGNPRRGYHSWATTVVFVYLTETECFIPAREQEMVEAIVHKKGAWMWYQCRAGAPHTWVAHYGYDSGD